VDPTRVLVATESDVLLWTGATEPAALSRFAGRGRPTCLTFDRLERTRAWCGTREGVLVSDDEGRTWAPSGLEGEHVMSIATSPGRTGMVWVGTEPSEVWRSADRGRSWTPSPSLHELDSSSEWSFPPKPDTHHVRWIACHPSDERRLWVAIEAGALVTTSDGGGTWSDRVTEGPFDTHELAIHPDAPERLRVAAGDGYFESADGGSTWTSPMEGLGVPYLRSVAIDPGDPEVVVVSGASGPRSAYVAGRADGLVYRREGSGRWAPVAVGWPTPAGTIAPLLAAGNAPGELWAADERGVHRSRDGGSRWTLVHRYAEDPAHLRGLAVGG
jgi:photosystem II stability/assembly factor-like uncharacterized protein